MKFDWFRSWHGAPTDLKWRGIARMANVPVPTVVAIVWALMDDASQNTDRGSILHFDPQTIAAFFDLDENDVRAVVLALKAKGVIDEDDRFRNWESRQPKREDLSTDRWRDWRDRQEALANDDKRTPTQSNAVPTQANAATDIANGTERETLERETTESERGDSPPLNPQRARYARSRRAREAETTDKSKASASRQKTALPQDWQPSAANLADAAAEGLTDPATIEREARAFADHARSEIRRSADWDAAWRGWTRRAAQMPTGPPKQSRFRKPQSEEIQDALAQYRSDAQARKTAGKTG